MLYSVHLLRFFAAAMVIVAHVGIILHTPPGKVHPGQMGVDIFFVISGLVIGVSTRDGDSPIRFAIKRFIRVVPSYWLATLALTAFHYATHTGTVIGPVPGTPPSANEILLSLSFLSTLTHAFFPVVFQGWTLSYEMLFYTIYGLTLALVRKNVSVVCMLVVLALVASGAPQLCFEFVLGLGLSTLVTRLRAGNMPIGVACLGLAMALLYTTPFGFSQPITWGIPSALIIIGVIQFERFGFLKHRLCVVLGDASYAIYLFHILLMSIAKDAASAIGFDLSGNPLLANVVFITVAVTGGIAIDLLIIGPMTRGLKTLPALVRHRRRGKPGVSDVHAVAGIKRHEVNLSA